VHGFVLAEASINAFVIAGGILAVWAVIVSMLGMRGFPGNRGGQRIAIGITVVLFIWGFVYFDRQAPRIAEEL